MLRGLRKIAGLALAFALVGAASALAQPGGIPKAADDDRFSFGPPLRRNVVLAYKYTERVKTVNELNGHAFDSSERVLSYFITERQVPGFMQIERAPGKADEDGDDSQMYKVTAVAPRISPRQLKCRARERNRLSRNRRAAGGCDLFIGVPASAFA